MENTQPKLSFEERLELYKLAKRPRKMIKLKFGVIQKESLPFLQKSSQSLSVPKGMGKFTITKSTLKSMKQQHSITLNRLSKSIVQSQHTSKNQDTVFLKSRNEYSQLKQLTNRAMHTLHINMALKEIENTSLRKYNQVITNVNKALGVLGP